MPSSHLLFLGTYTRNTTSKGIYAVRLDSATGALNTPIPVADSPDPAWITLSPNKKFLYAIHPSPAQATGFALDITNGKLTPLSPPTSSPTSPSSAPSASPAASASPASPPPSAQPPSHLAADATGRALLAANYREGYVSAIPIRPDGTLGLPNSIKHEGQGTHPTRQEKPHVHSVTVSPDNRFVIVVDLGLDKIFTYALDAATAQLTPASPPFVPTEPGAGPRHFKFSTTGRHAYVINELANTITAYSYDTSSGALTPLQTVPTLPADFPSAASSTTAEIRVHPNGKFLYGSNRGHDSIAVFAIDPATGFLSAAPLQIIPSGGKNPRNFALSPDGAWLVCGHQDTELVTVFHIDAASGRLTATPHHAKVPSVVCVLFAD